MRRAAAALVVFAGLAGGWCRLTATTFDGERPDLPLLVSRAERIGEFEVLDRRCAQLPDGSIETRYTLSTILPMKGIMPSVQEIRLPGGVVAGKGLLLPGMPDMEIGERTILFLSGQGAVKPWRVPVGLAAGAFRVVRDGRALRVVRDLRRQEGGGLEIGDHDQLVGEIFAEIGRQG